MNMPETSRREAAEQPESRPRPPEHGTEAPEEKKAEVIPINPEVARSREQESLAAEYRQAASRIRSFRREIRQLQEGLRIEREERESGGWLSGVMARLRGKKPIRYDADQRKDLDAATADAVNEINVLHRQIVEIEERLSEEKRGQLREEQKQLDRIDTELQGDGA